MHHACPRRFYKGGIFAPTGLSTQYHAMTIVGYNKTGGIGAPGTFYKVKNSWGPEFGESGYVRVGMAANSTEGVGSMYTYMTYPLDVGSVPGGPHGAAGRERAGLHAAGMLMHAVQVAEHLGAPLAI